MDSFQKNQTFEVFKITFLKKNCHILNEDKFFRVEGDDGEHEHNVEDDCQADPNEMS